MAEGSRGGEGGRLQELGSPRSRARPTVPPILGVSSRRVIRIRSTAILPARASARARETHASVVAERTRGVSSGPTAPPTPAGAARPPPAPAGPGGGAAAEGR